MPTLKQLREIVAACPHLDGERIEQTFQKLLALDRMAIGRVHEVVTRAKKPKPRSKGELPAIEPGTPYGAMTTIQAVVAVLSEGTPLDSVALTVAIQERGHRASDDPRLILKAVRSAVSKHRRHFIRHETGKYEILASVQNA